MQATIASLEDRIEDLERRWRERFKKRIPIQYGTVDIDERGKQTVSFSERFEEKPQVFLSAMKQEGWYEAVQFPTTQVDLPNLSLRKVSIGKPKPLEVPNVTVGRVKVPPVPTVSLPSVDIIPGSPPSPPSVELKKISLKGIEVPEFEMGKLKKKFKALPTPSLGVPSFKDRFNINRERFDWKPRKYRGRFRKALVDAVRDKIWDYLPDLPTLEIPKPWTLYLNWDLDINWGINADLDIDYGFKKHWTIDLREDIIKPIVNALLWVVRQIGKLIAWMLNIFFNAVIKPLVNELEQKIKDRVQDALNNFKNRIRNRLNDFRDNIKSFFKDGIRDNIKKFRERMNDRVGDAIDSVISNVQEAINRKLIGNPENPAEESLNAAFADFSDTLEQN